MTLSPSKCGSSVSTSAVERRVFLARDALAGVEHRVKGFALWSAKALTLVQLRRAASRTAGSPAWGAKLMVRCP
jgi:hypothetical protein